MLLKLFKIYGLECHYNLNFNKKIFNFSSNIRNKNKNNNKLSIIDLAVPGVIINFNLYFLKNIVLIGFYLKNYLFYISFFIRKSYFYADIIKNYQVSQLKSNIGFCLIIIYNNLIIKPYYKFIKIAKIHMEEDSGKINYQLLNRQSLVNFNRSNSFLLEIVSHYNLNSFYEIFLYLNNLKNKFQFLKKNNTNNFLKFDVNISLKFLFYNFNKFKIEIKNINSLYILKNVIIFEFKRQVFNNFFLKNYKNETRFFDVNNKLTYFIRNKESKNYKYIFEFNKNSITIPNYYITLKRNHIISFFYYKMCIKYNFSVILKKNFYLIEKFFFIFKLKKKNTIKLIKFILNNIKNIKLSLLELILIIKSFLNNIINFYNFKKIIFISNCDKKNLSLIMILIKLKLNKNLNFHYFLNYILISNLKFSHSVLFDKKIINFFLGILKTFKIFKKFNSNELKSKLNIKKREMGEGFIPHV